MATVPIFYCSLFLTRQQSQHISFLKKTVYLVKQKVFSASERKERDRENKKGVRAVKRGQGSLEAMLEAVYHHGEQCKIKNYVFIGGERY